MTIRDLLSIGIGIGLVRVTCILPHTTFTRDEIIYRWVHEGLLSSAALCYDNLLYIAADKSSRRHRNNPGRYVRKHILLPLGMNARI